MKRILLSLLLGGTVIWAAFFAWSPAPAMADPPAAGWTSIRFAGSFVHHVATSPDGSYVYSVSSGSTDQVRRHLDVSKDGGATWARVTPSSAPNMLAISVANPEEIIAATNTGLYRSTNAGTSWGRPTGPLVGSANFRSIVRATSNPFVVWAQTQSVSGSSSLLKSSDGGATWGLVSALTPFHGAVMAIDPKDELTVYVAAFQKLHKTVDGGLTWTATLLGGQVDAISGVAIDPVNPAIVYLSGYPHTVKSVNGGVSFTTFGLGYYPSPTANRISGPVAVGPDQKLYLVGRASGSWQPKGVWQHDGTQWKQVPGLLITTNEVAPTATAVYAATEGGLYRLGYAPIAPPPPIPDTYPVIVIPGIMGSWKDHGVWRLDPISHTYDGLIAALVESGYREGVDLFPFPYEWRASNVDTAELLRAKIDQIQAQTGQAKVNIVAHSMGGLVARQYIQGIHYGNDVSKLILIGVPNLGAPNAYLVWEGEDFSYMDPIHAFILKQAFRVEAAKSGYARLYDYIHQRVPSLGELLPIYNYLKDADTGAWRNYPHRYPANAFLENLELNRGQVTARGVQVFSIAGSMGSTSTNGILTLSPSASGLWPDGRPSRGGIFSEDESIEKVDGDVTVPFPSATLFGSPSVLLGKHGEIATLSQNEVIEILGRPELSELRRPKSFGRLWLLFVHSPVEVSVKRGGVPVVADFYTGAEEEPQILSLPDPGDGEYEVVATGVGTGSYQIDLGIYNTTIEQGAVTATLNGQTTPGEVDRMRVVVSGDTISIPPDSGPTTMGRGGGGDPEPPSSQGFNASSSLFSQFLPAERGRGEPRILAPGSRHHSPALGAILAMVILGATIYALARFKRLTNR